jgi:ankyrin repeat domain-containing protein 17
LNLIFLFSLTPQIFAREPSRCACTNPNYGDTGADVNRQTTNNDHTTLSLACAGGHQTVVELLLKSTADKYHKLKDNSTILLEAVKGGHFGVV